MIVFFVYNILISNYKDTKNYRDYQLFKRISYPELRFCGKKYKRLLIIASNVKSDTLFIKECHLYNKKNAIICQ